MSMYVLLSAPTQLGFKQCMCLAGECPCICVCVCTLCKEEGHGDDLAPSMSTFRKVWRQWSPRHLGIRAVNQHRCQLCTEYAEWKRVAVTRTSQKLVCAEFRRHLLEQYRDRAVYARTVVLASTAANTVGGVEPESSYLSLVIDGMDQSKFACPRVSSSGFNDIWRPRLHMCGILVHGVADIFILSNPDEPKNASNNVELLAHALDTNNEIRLTPCVQDVASNILASKRVPLPCHLCVQADNTCREQKNSTGLLWMALQVYKGTFKSACQSHLTKGHSHIDVDQRFSEVNTCIHNADHLQTPQDFLEAMETRVSKKNARPTLLDHFLCRVHATEVVCERVGAIRNWAKYFEDGLHSPHREDKALKLTHHTGPTGCHVFHFVRRVDLPNQSWVREKVPEVDHGVFASLGLEENDYDIILLTRAFMHSESLLQAPLLFLPAAMARNLNLMGPTTTVPLNNINDREKQEYRKTAKLLRADPWQMHRAAEWLEELVDNNTEGKHALPLLELRTCLQTTHATAEPVCLPDDITDNMEPFIRKPTIRPVAVAFNSRQQEPKRRRLDRKQKVTNALAQEASSSSTGIPAAAAAAASQPASSKQKGTLGPRVPDFPPEFGKLGCSKCRGSAVG
eukprot:6492697-Amphidinium_carterae.3